MILFRRLFPAFVIFPLLMMAGAVGYRMIEDWAWKDCLYMSIITVTTVGFGEVHALSLGGRILTAFLVIMGVGNLMIVFSSLADYLFVGELKGVVTERKMRRLIDETSEHYIVCGYGEMGRQICLEFRRKGCLLVVIDRREEAVRMARDQGYLALAGDAGLDSVLLEAGLERARGLVAATDDDATNLLVVLTSKGINSAVPVVARANLEEVIHKLHRAGADRVLFSQSLAGRRMAQMLLHPEVSDFLDVVSHTESLELILENFRVYPGCIFEKKNLRQARIRELTGANIVGLKRPGREVITSIDPDTVLEAGDIIFAIGTREQMGALSSMAGSPVLPRRPPAE